MKHNTNKTELQWSGKQKPNKQVSPLKINAIERFINPIINISKISQLKSTDSFVGDEISSDNWFNKIIQGDNKPILNWLRQNFFEKLQHPIPVK